LRKKDAWGERGELNPQPLEPQASAPPNELQPSFRKTIEAALWIVELKNLRKGGEFSRARRARASGGIRTPAVAKLFRYYSAGFKKNG
jgi:hypothetical protein